MKANRRARREARRLYQACRSEGQLDPGHARETAHRVAQSRRRGSLAVLSHLRRLVALDRARHQALVESAVPLPIEFQMRMESLIARRYGAHVSTSFEVKPALIAGMRVKVGSDVYDGSVRTALDRLEERFR